MKDWYHGVHNVVGIFHWEQTKVSKIWDCKAKIMIHMIFFFEEKRKENVNVFLGIIFCSKYQYKNLTLLQWLIILWILLNLFISFFLTLFLIFF